ncbi:MAG: hypothetical protein WCL08_00410 [Verrucomicrobiota bacterium]
MKTRKTTKKKAPRKLKGRSAVAAAPTGSVIAIPRTDAAISCAETASQLVHNLATLSAELERENERLKTSFRELRRYMVAAGNHNIARYCANAITSQNAESRPL